MTPEQEARIALEHDEELVDAIIFGEKRCSACTRMRPKCPPYFSHDARNTDGLKHECNDCISARERVRRGAKTDVEWRTVDGELVDRLVARLRKRGLTLEEIAERSGCSLSTIKVSRTTKMASTLRRLLALSDELTAARR